MIIAKKRIGNGNPAYNILPYAVKLMISNYNDLTVSLTTNFISHIWLIDLD